MSGRRGSPRTVGEAHRERQRGLLAMSASVQREPCLYRAAVHGSTGSPRTAGEARRRRQGKLAANGRRSLPQTAGGTHRERRESLTPNGSWMRFQPRPYPCLSAATAACRLIPHPSWRQRSSPCPLKTTKLGTRRKPRRAVIALPTGVCRFRRMTRAAAPRSRSIPSTMGRAKRQPAQKLEYTANRTGSPLPIRASGTVPLEASVS